MKDNSGESQKATKKKESAVQKPQGPNSLEQQPAWSSIIRRTRQDAHSLTSADLLALQKMVGNRVARKHVPVTHSHLERGSRKSNIVQRARTTEYTQRTTIQQATNRMGEVVQRNPYNYESGRLDEGQIQVKEEAKLISAKGSFKDEEGGVKVIDATLDFKFDKDNPKRIVIGNIKATPKRTGTGSILVYHLANFAAANGFDTLGTDLSALEEGTPEFYQSIGLNPDPPEDMRDTIADMFKEAATTDDLELKQRLQEGAERALWAGRLNAKVTEVLNRTRAKVEAGHWSLKQE